MTMALLLSVSSNGSIPLQRCLSVGVTMNCENPFSILKRIDTPATDGLGWLLERMVFLFSQYSLGLASQRVHVRDNYLS